MLIKVKHLQAIRAGAVSLAFRKWKTLRVKQDSLIKTAVGLIKIIEICELTSEEEISLEEAKAAGYEFREELLKTLKPGVAGRLYKIQLAYHGPDPRLALREQSELTPGEREEIRHKLARMDAATKQGPWTQTILTVIAENPKCRAVDLAGKLGWDKIRLKANIRKLKNLGLTISHAAGYTLSPRGEAVLPLMK